MTSEPTSNPRRSPTWMRILLGVSLALNLAVVGLAIGASFRVLGPGGPPPPPHSFGGALIRGLPVEDRKDISRRARDTLGSRRDHRADAERLITALRSDPFDQAAVAGLIEAQSSGRQAWAAALQSAWLEKVTAMTADERQAYADALEEAEKRRAEKRKRFKAKRD